MGYEHLIEAGEHEGRLLYAINTDAGYTWDDLTEEEKAFIDSQNRWLFPDGLMPG